MRHKTERPRWLGAAKVLSLLLAAVLCVAGLTRTFAAGELSISDKDQKKLDLSIVPVSTDTLDKAGNTVQYAGTWKNLNESDSVNEDPTAIRGLASSLDVPSYNEELFMPRTATLRIQNTTGQAVRLTFDWKMKDAGNYGNATGSVNVAGFTTEIGNYKGTLQPNGEEGDSILVKVTSPSNASTGSNPPIGRTYIYLSNFNVESAADDSITLWPAEGGSYTVTTGGQSSKTVESNGEQSTYGFMSTTGIEVSAAPADGMDFYMWWDPTTGIPYSTSKSVSLHPNGTAIQPVFVKTGERQPNFLVKTGTTEEQFIYWQDAMLMAASGDSNSKTVILGQDYELPKDVTGHDGAYVTTQENGTVTYSLPSQVTLVVPYDESNNTSPNKVVNTEGKDPGHSKAFRTLTVPAGVKLDVPSAATLILNAVQGGKTGASSMGRIIGDYAEMKVYGSVEVTGTLYARGFVTGTGQVTAHSSSTIYQLMQIQDWRGGGLTFGMYGQLMAINMYTFENIMTPMTYEGGSTLMVQACVAHGSNIAMSVDVAAMANGTGGRSSIFVLDNKGEVRTTYDPDKDRLNISITKGTVKMGFLALEISMGTGEPFIVDSAKYPLAVNDSMSITVKSGATLQTDYDLKFLPGTVVTVEEGARMIVSENSHLYFYSRNSYKNGYADDQERTRLDYDVIQKPGTTVTSDADATLEMHGELVLQGTLMQSADGKGGLMPYKNAQVTVVNTPVQTAVVNECYGKGQAYNDSATGATSVKNGDSYYVEVKSWRAIKGRMAEYAYDPTGEAFTPFAEVGTYKTIKIGGTLYWYQHQVDYTYERANGVDNAVALPDKEITYISRSTANHAVAGVGTQRFYAVDAAVSEGTATVKAGANSANTVLTDGVEDVALANVTEDTTVTLTVRPYTHKVTWEEYASADATEANNTFAHYVTGATDSATWDEATSVDVITCSGAKAEPDGKTIKVTEFTGGAVVKALVLYNGYPVRINMVIPGATITKDGVTGGLDLIEDKVVEEAKYLYTLLLPVEKDSGANQIPVTTYAEAWNNYYAKEGYTFANVAVNSYYIIEKINYTGNADITCSSNGDTLTVSNAQSAVEITVTLKPMSYKADFQISSLWYKSRGASTEDQLTASPVYFNTGDQIELKNTDVQSSSDAGFKYMFTGSTDSAATVTEDKLTFDTTNVTVDENGVATFSVSMTYYDFIATLKAKNGKVLKNIYMQDYVSDGDGKNTACRYDESIVTSGRAPLPYETAKKVTVGGVSYMSYTHTFNKGEALNAIGSEIYEVTEQTFTEGPVQKTTPTLTVTAANAGANGQASVTITAASYVNTTNNSQKAITENCVVTVDPVAYDHIVTFVDQNDTPLAKQYVAGDTATYTAAANTVITNVEAGSYAYTNTGTTVTVSDLTGNPKITLTTAKYDSCVTWSITKDGTQYTANQFIVSSGSTYKTVALLGNMESNLAGIAIVGSNAVLTAGNKLVVANGATYTGTGLTWTPTTITVPAYATGTVSLTLKAYDHTVIFKQGGAVLETQYVKENANVITNGHVFYNKLTDKVITGYTISGDRADTATAAGGTDESTEVQYGWSIITIGNITSDLTVDLTTKDYAYQLQWIIQSPGNTANETLKPRYYSESETPEWTADSEYLIVSAVPAGATATPVIDGRTVKLTEVAVTSTNKRVTATVTLKSAVTHLITYTVNGGTATVDDPKDGAWTYKPADGYEITGAVVTGDAGVIVTNLRTSLTITGITAKPINVAITTAQTATEPTAPEGEAVALWGDMSYQYYRCASVYRWDGTDANNGQWTPADTFAWRHSAGSRSYTVDGDRYTVPNGSIALVNSTAKPVTYTVKLETDESTVVGMRWSATGKQENIHTNERDLIVITVPAGENILVTGEMFTLPNAEVESGLTDKNIGHITVGTATVSD